MTYGVYALDSLSVPETGPASIQFIDAENAANVLPVELTTREDVARVTRGIRDQLAHGVANIDAPVASVTGRVLDAGEGRPMLLTKMGGRDRVVALDLSQIPGATGFDFEGVTEITATGSIKGRTMQPFSLSLRSPEPEATPSADF